MYTMFTILSIIGNVIETVLLLPISAIIEGLANAIYYFLAASWFIGYCLVQAGVYIWGLLCDCYQIGTVVFKESAVLYAELKHIAGNIWDYIYYGTGDGLSLAHYLAEQVLIFVGKVLIALGNLTLWLILLVPRAIIILADYMILVLDQLITYMIERSKIILNNLFQLSIGLFVLLALYMFRRYVQLLVIQLYTRAYNEISAKLRLALHWASDWMDQQLSRMSHKLGVGESPSADRSRCVVCLERNKNIVILPCRHLCLCKDCSRQIHRFEGGDRCPVCRHHVESLMPVYD